MLVLVVLTTAPELLIAAGGSVAALARSGGRQPTARRAPQSAPGTRRTTRWTSWTACLRLNLRAKLDALYFHLYGVTDRDDIRYVYSTFPIVEREEKATYGSYRSRDLCPAWTSALAAGHPDAEVDP